MPANAAESDLHEAQQEITKLRRELSAAMTSIKNHEYARRHAVQEAERLRKELHLFHSASWADTVWGEEAWKQRALVAEKALEAARKLSCPLVAGMQKTVDNPDQKS